MIPKVSRPLETATQAMLARDNFIRANGDMVCICGNKYYDHSQDTDDYHWLRVLCNGKRVKL